MANKKTLFPFFLVICLLLTFFTSCPDSPEMQKLTAPVISASSEVIDEDTLITITSSENASIYYTTDGSDPMTSETRKQYQEPFKPTLDSNITIKAYATLSGYLDSDIVEMTYSYSGKLPAPAFQYENESAIPFTSVSVSVDVAEGYVIYYTTDGSDPSKDSLQTQNNVIDLSDVEGNTVTIKAFTSKEGMNDSDIVTVTYTRKKVSTPQITPESQMFEGEIEITITAKDGAQIFYTLNGEDPTISSNSYSGPFTITNPATVKAIAIIEGCIDSEIAVAEYSLNTSAPKFSTEDGIIPFLDNNLTISAGESDVIYYTTDGSDPTTSSASAIGSVTLTIDNEDTVVKAMAKREGYEQSKIVSITIKQASISSAEISFPTPFILNESKVTLTTEEEGATITYSFEEFGKYVEYSEPFTISVPSVTYHYVYAKVEKDGYKSSFNVATIDAYERTSSVPIFSLPDGSPNSENIKLSISAPGAVYYTTDGSEPNLDSDHGFSPSFNLSSSISEIKAMYVDGKKISDVATLKLENSVDSKEMEGEWISALTNITVNENTITIGDDNYTSSFDYALTSNNLFIFGDGYGMDELLYTLSSDAIEITIKKELITLNKDGNRYVNGDNSIILNDEAFLLDVNGIFYFGEVSGSSLTVDTLIVTSDISSVDISTGPIKIPNLGTICRKPEFIVSPESLDGIAVNEEVEFSLTCDSLPSGITIGDITYVLRTYEEPLASGSYLPPIKYTPKATGSLICEFTILLTIGENERPFIAGREYSVKERYGTPYLGPYTVLTDYFHDGDGIDVAIHDLDASFGYLYYTTSEVYYGEDYQWNPNRTVADGHKNNVSTYNEDYMQAGAIKGNLSGSSSEFLPSKPNVKTFYVSDTSSEALSGTWYGSMNHGGNNINLTLEVGSDSTYSVSADGLGTLYEGKARYSNEKNMILIDFKKDNKLSFFDPVSLTYSYDEGKDELTINGASFYRASGEKGSVDGYWIEKDQENEILRREFVLDGEWMAYRGALYDGRKDIYIYEGGYSKDANVITFPSSSSDSIDSYYILSYPCLSEDGKTLSVAGLDFHKE